LIKASIRAANHSDTKQCSRLNTRSAHEYTKVPPGQLLRNGREQWPSNDSGLGPSALGGWERVDLILVP
jgi:hypothetical protein